MLFVVLALVTLAACKTTKDAGTTAPAVMDQPTPEPVDPLAVVRAFYDAYNIKDFEALDDLISEDVLVLEDGSPQAEGKRAYLNLVRYGQAITTTVEPQSFRSDEYGVTVDEVQDNQVVQFFYGGTIQTTTVFDVNDEGQITEISTTLPPMSDQADLKASDFMEWAKLNHPETFTRILDFNAEGGQAFKELIDLYGER